MTFVLPSDADPDPTPMATKPFALPSEQPDETPAKKSASKFRLPSDEDETPAEAPAPESAVNPNGVLSNAPDDSWKSGVAKGTGTAAVQGVSGALGMVGSLRDLLTEGTDRLYSLTSGMPLEQARARNAKLRADFEQSSIIPDPMKLFPSASDVESKITPITGAYQPQSEAGRLAQAGLAAGIGGALLNPEAALTAALPNAASGVAAQGASDLGANPLVATAAGMLGGVGADVAAGTRTARLLTPKGRDEIAGQTILNSASDPAALKAAAATDTAAGDELVSGSQPTLFQRYGDQGIGQAERAARTQDPAPFLERAAQQSKAQVDTLSSLPTGYSQDLADHLTSQLRDLDHSTQLDVDTALQDAQKKAQALGPGLSPEEHGNALRSILSDARDAAKANENALWKAVDPDGTLVNSMQPVKDAAKGVYGNLSNADIANLSPSEGTFLGLIKGYKAAEPFSELQGLKTNLGAAMRQELFTNGRTPAYGRMSGLMDGVYDAINNTIAHKVEADESAVAAGAMSPEDTMAAKLHAEVNAYRNAKAEATGSNLSGGNPGITGSGSAGVSGANGAKVQGGRGPSNPPGDQGVSPTPNFDQAAADRLAAANAATKARVATFDKGPVGQVLARGQTADTFKLQDSLVPGKIFKPGPTGGETVDAFRKATGGIPASESALQNAAADSLHAKALGTDGTVDPVKFASWVKDHAPALSRMDPQFVRGLVDAPTATQTLAKVAAARKQALDAYQKGAVGKLVGASDPVTIQRAIGSIFGARDAVPQMRRLAQEAAKDKTGEATAGLRKAIVDHIETSFLKDIAKGSEQESAIKANAFQVFVRKNAAVLEQVFSPEEMNNFRAISQDIARQNQSVINKVPGPGTAQDMFAQMRRASAEAHDTLLGSLWKSALVGREVVEPVAEHLGAAGDLIVPGISGLALGKRAVQAMSNAGMHKVQDLVKAALLDPQLARTLVMKASKYADRGSQHSLAQQLKRLSVLGPSQVPQRASGGRVTVDQNPTEAQKAVGNYLKHHMRIHGLDVTIENPRGSWRSGVGADGKSWRVKLPHHYGYIRGTIGADDDHVDCYVGPDEESDKVFVIDQKDMASGKFDEHKCMIGFKNRDAAIGGYCQGFSDGNGAKRIKKITTMSVDEFKAWLASGKTREPISRAA